MLQQYSLIATQDRSCPVQACYCSAGQLYFCCSTGPFHRCCRPVSAQPQRNCRAHSLCCRRRLSHGAPAPCSCGPPPLDRRHGGLSAWAGRAGHSCRRRGSPCLLPGRRQPESAMSGTMTDFKRKYCTCTLFCKRLTRISCESELNLAPRLRATSHRVSVLKFELGLSSWLLRNQSHQTVLDRTMGAVTMCKLE